MQRDELAALFQQMMASFEERTAAEFVALHDRHTKDQVALAAQLQALQQHVQLQTPVAASSSAVAPVPEAVLGAPAASTQAGEPIRDTIRTSLEPFSGEVMEDADLWLFRVQLLAPASDDAKILLAKRHLTGMALRWLRDSPPLEASWVGWSAAFLNRFRPINAVELARAELATLRQSGALRDVQLYCEAFSRVLARIPDIAVADQVWRFKEGLSDPLRLHLALHSFATLAEAQCAAVQAAACLRPAAHPVTAARPAEVLAVEELRHCYQCGRQGHIKRDCPQRTSRSHAPPRPQRRVSEPAHFQPRSGNGWAQ
jgi:hypothetical protein